MKKRTILSIFLGAYCMIAVINVGYNLVNTVSEIKNWYFLSDTQKRHKLFGDLYDFFMFIDQNTPQNASILIVSSDVRTFFLGRYYLYPKKIVVAENIDNKKLYAYPYIASFGKSLDLAHYTLIGSCAAKGYLYKKNE